MLLIVSSTFDRGAHAEHDQERDRGRLAVEPCADNRAVQDQPDNRLLGQRTGIPGVPVALHFAPSPAHRVLADRSAEQGRQRSAHPARVGAGEIAAGDQRVGGQRAALIGPQRLALPFRRLALGGVQSGARHRDLDRPEGPGQRPRPAAMAVARNARIFFIASHRPSPVTRACKCRIELAADQLFDEPACPTAPRPRSDRTSGRKINSHLGCRLRKSDFVVMLVMAWSPVRRFNAGQFEVGHPGDYATLNSYQPSDGTILHSLALLLSLFLARGVGQETPEL